MRTREYEMILDSLRMTGIYVIREDNHQILYYNKQIKESVPNIREGMVCHEAWEETCSNCPLQHIGEGKEARAVSYDNLFGKAVEIGAARIFWEDSIPAFMITITPYSRTEGFIYHKVLRADLGADSYSIVRENKEEMPDAIVYEDSLSGYFERAVQNGYIYEEDVKRYRKFVQIDRMIKELKDGAKILNCIYRRKVGDRFRWHILEIVPQTDFSQHNPKIMICLKDVHDLFREGLEREEINIRNQEIIHALGETNFAIYVVDLQSGGVNIVRATDRVKKTFKPGIFLWDSLFEGSGLNYIAAEDQKEFQNRFSLRAMQQAFAGGEEKRTFVCRALLGGEWRYISTSAFFKESRKQGAYVIMTFQDVDERTKKEMERTQNDRRMAVIVRSRFHILSTVDLETGMCERIYLREGDPGRRETVDYSCFIRKALEESVAEEDRVIFADMFLLENLRKKAQTVQEYKEELCQYRCRGMPVQWIEKHIFYIRQGNRTNVNILGRDITQEKLAEEQARRDARQKASIINSLSSMFFATYYIDLEDDTFQVVTQKAEVGSVLGDAVSYTHALQLYAYNFVHPDDREEYLEHMKYENLVRSLNREHSLLAFEYRVLPSANNEKRWIRATIVLAETTKDGRPKRALYVAQDVTESKWKEEQEQQALREACESANHANEAKSEFMSRMSHDIRTPINGIIGMTSIAGWHLDDKERVADCLDKIMVSGRHLLSLINEVLDMSKIESGKFDLAEEKISLIELTENLVTMIRPSAEAKNHTFDVSTAGVEHEHVIGDSVRLQQIFMNILGNAVKYTPQGGRIRMEISERPSAAYGCGCYEFVFQDNGIGMSREFQEKMFEPFSREEDSRVSKIEGTGLGMSIARNIVRRMNGDIMVDSTPGRGTRFVVMLSLKIVDMDAADTGKRKGQKRQEKQEAETLNREYLKGKRILLVEDNELNQEIAVEIISQTGVMVECADNGRIALERFEKMPVNYYDLILMDIQMPVMNGYDATVALRRLPREDAAGIPVIAMTANAFAEDIQQSKISGMNEHLTKPLNIDELMACLERWMV